jgi:hypothetical protein
MPVRPGDGGFACIEGSHKQNYSLPRACAVLEPPHGTPETHPFARAVSAEAGSAIVFTEVRDITAAVAVVADAAKFTPAVYDCVTRR